MKQLEKENGDVLEKAPTGIHGLDEITYGGIPRGCSTLVCGPAGSGKTIIGLEFIMRGAAAFEEPGVYLSFEESRDKIIRNVKAFGFDWEKLEKANVVWIDNISHAPADEEAGDFDLTGLFLRIERAITKVNARRLVIDGLECLFSSFNNKHILRKEIVRLFEWLEEKQMTTIISAERGESSLTRHGFEEYLADCVIALDHRINDQLSTRRLRVIKYRGTYHSTDEVPFVIDQDGISVLPLTSLGLNHNASRERVSTGIDSLDAMFGGKGYFKGSSILVSGTAGTGKSSIAGTFVNAACRREEKTVYFAFEESKAQICRNMGSIGLNLDQWVEKGLLRFEAFRPTVYGLESHLANIQRTVLKFKPTIVVIDPITNFNTLGTSSEVKNMLMRLIDFLKTHGITALFTSLTEGGDPVEQSSVGVSSLIDTWILVRDIEMAGERNRGLYVLKSRGMSHSNQIREFVITEKGLDLVPVYIGKEGVLIGAARIAKEVEAKAASNVIPDNERRLERLRDQRRKAMEAEIMAVKTRYEADDQELVDASAAFNYREAGLKAEQAHRDGHALNRKGNTI